MFQLIIAAFTMGLIGSFHCVGMCGPLALSLPLNNDSFLSKFVNEQGRILPRRLTGTSLKYQRKVGQAIARARHLALMPYVADLYK